MPRHYFPSDKACLKMIAFNIHHTLKSKPSDSTTHKCLESIAGRVQNQLQKDNYSVNQNRVGSKSNGGRPDRLHSSLKKQMEYHNIYNDYVRRVNDEHSHPDIYQQDVPYAPAHMVALEHGIARTTVRRIFKSLQNVDFKGKLKLYY